MSPISTLQFSKAAAQNWTDQKLKEGNIVLPGKRGAPFETFAQGFWDYQGEYVQRKLARGGHFCKTTVLVRQGALKKWILPHFKDQPVGSIKRQEIEDWTMELYKTSGLTPASINRVLDCMKVMMKEAVRRGYANTDPAASVCWTSTRNTWQCPAVGRSEVVFMGAKWGSERIVPIPSRVTKELETLAASFPFKEPEDLLLAGETRGKPVKKEALEATFYDALDGIGINEETRRKRVLVWHSLRHNFNSIMKGKIDSAKLMKVVGHRQESTNFQYTHALPKDLEEVRELQEALVGGPSPEPPNRSLRATGE